MMCLMVKCGETLTLLLLVAVSVNVRATNVNVRRLDPVAENQTVVLVDWHPVPGEQFHVLHVDDGTIFNSFDNYTDSRYTVLLTISNPQTYMNSLRVVVNGLPTADIAGRYVVETDAGQIVDTVDVEITPQQPSSTDRTLSTSSAGVTVQSTASTNTDLPFNTTSTVTAGALTITGFIAALFVAIFVHVYVFIRATPNPTGTTYNYIIPF